MDLLFVGFLLFWLWALYDVITVDQHRVRNLPKVLWIGIVIVLFIIGALCWVFLGRPPRELQASQPQAPRRPRRHAPPEPETPRDAAQRVITDRRSAELDRMLEEWERGRGDEDASDG
jgi:type VI protein secretion system component VasK